MANDSTELTIPIEKNPHFTLQNDLDSETNVWGLDYFPHYGMIAAQPSALCIPAITMACFNPASIPFLEKVKVGDFINATADIHHPIFTAWNPPKDYMLEEGFQKMYVVKNVDEDALGFPIIVAEEAL